MKGRRIAASAGLLLAGVAWPLALDRVTVRADLERRADAAADALLDARRIREEIEVARERYSQFAVEAQDLERRLVILRRRLPAAADRATALADLRQAAGSFGVALLAWEEKPPREQPPCREVPLGATLEGPTAAVLHLAEQMEGRVAQTALSRLELTPALRPGFARAEIEITLLELPAGTRGLNRPSGIEPRGSPRPKVALGGVLGFFYAAFPAGLTAGTRTTP